MPVSSIALLPVVYVDAFMWLPGMFPTLYDAFAQGRVPTHGSVTLLGGPFKKLGLEALIVAGIVYLIVSAVFSIINERQGSRSNDSR